jgi:hypothetical protein
VGNARQPRQRSAAGDLVDVPDTPVSDRIGAGSGQQQQLAAHARPRRLAGQSAEQTLGAPVEVGNDLWSGEVFGGDVEGVKVTGRGGAEPDGEILLLPQQGAGRLW